MKKTQNKTEKTPKTESTNTQHRRMVVELCKNPQDIVFAMTDKKADLMHQALGVAGESGEIVDAIKKFSIYNKPLDHENLIEELGDMEFYMEKIRRIIGVSREDTLKANIAKLRKRYSKGYSDKQAADRADKAGEVKPE
jgi:NTP pyrophosphatase (non-canonical NTP hydrolase)